MLKIFNKYIRTAMFVSLLFLVLGVIILIYPEFSITFFSYAFAVILIMTGLYLVIDKMDSWFSFTFFNSGILSILLGVVILIYPSSLKIVVPIVVGIWMIVNSLYAIKISTILKGVGYSNWLFTIIMSVLGIVCGCVMIANTNLGAAAITTYLGISLIVYSISFLVDLIIFKRNVNKIVKELD